MMSQRKTKPRALPTREWTITKGLQGSEDKLMINMVKTREPANKKSRQGDNEKMVTNSKNDSSAVA